MIERSLPALAAFLTGWITDFWQGGLGDACSEGVLIVARNVSKALEKN